MSPATSATPCGCATSSPASSCPTRSPTPSPGATFSPDGRFIVYTTVDDAWRPDTVWLHELGTPVDDDVKLFHEPDERYWVGAGFTRSDRYLVIGMGSSITSEEWLVDAADLRSEPRVVWPRSEGVEYDSSHAVIDGEDVLFILHNDGALDFELVRVAASDPAGARQVVVPHRPGERLLGVSTFRDWGVLGYRRGGLARLGMLDYADGAVAELEFDEPLYSVGSGGNPEWAPPLIRLGYGSFVTPGTVYDYEVATGDLHLRKRQPVLGGYEPDDYAQARVWATAQDGTQMPISLVWKRSFGDAGVAPRPLHLYGYGSYEHSIEPGFSVPRLSELDRGVIFAVAHVRGGGEMGRQWYEDGKLLHKRNTFTDFVDSARHLIDHGYTSRRPHGRRGRQRRRAADGRRRQPRARAVRRHPGRRAVRRRAHDDPRPVAAAHRDRVGRVGRPAAQRRRVRLHEVVLAVRERANGCRLPAASSR